MAHSGIPWIDVVFNTTVRWLYVWARYFGITYEEINVWLFCIAWPALTIFLVVWLVLVIRQNRRLKRQIRRVSVTQ
jgi:hypothetical protein